MHNEENKGKKRIFADLVALHQSIVSESPNEAVKEIDSKVSKKPRPQNPSASPDAIADNRYELFCDQMPMGVLLAEISRDRYRYPESYKPIKVNMVYAELLGLARVTILEKDFYDVLPGGKADWKDALTRVASKGKSESGTAYWDATDTHVRVTLFLPRRDLLAVVIENAGDLTPVLGSVAQHESQLDSVLRLAPEMVCRFLPDGELTYANRAYCEFFKKVREELQGHCFLDEIVKDDVGFVRSQLSLLNRDQPSVTYQHRFEHEVGLRWVEWTDIALFDKNGTIFEYQSFGRDVTDVRRETHETVRVAGLMDDLLRYRAQQHGVVSSQVTESALSSDVLASEVDVLKVEVERLRAKTIIGELLVCGTCQRVHDAEGHWMLVPLFLESHTAAHVASEVCPYCRSKATRDLERKQYKK
jgi:PAS domain S-box-containing protein